MRDAKPVQRLTQVVFLSLLFSCSHPVAYRQEKVDRPSFPSQREVVAAVPREKPQRTAPLAVVLDAGHGGEDFGAQSHTKPKHHEKYLTLATAFLVRNHLHDRGYNVIMTRKEDTFIPLDKRALAANELKPKIFVSVHYNSAPSTQAEGIEVFYYQSEKDPKRSQESKQLAQAVLDQLIGNTKAKSRGVKHGNFAVIRETHMPAILVEGGFLTNEKEIQKIKDPNYLQKIAAGIAQGVDQYLQEKRKALTFTKL